VCTLTAEQLDAYAARIGITLPLDATLDNLRMLIAAHHRSVPFENTALHMREKLPPDDMQHAYARIVEGRRGGICTDLNGMFAQLLSSLGFGVRFFATRVWLPTQVFTPIFMHMGLAVTIPGDNGRLWLADVGFPSMTYGPLDLSCNNTAHDEDKGDTFEVKLLNDGDVQVAMNGKLLFHAELRPRAASDFGLMVWFYCSSPEASLMMVRTQSISTLILQIERLQLAWSMHAHKAIGHHTHPHVVH
jgi:N-hydroxyarylamine O-acetyltransferase